MKARSWCVGALGVAAAAFILGITRPGYAVQPDRSYASSAFSFTIGATPAIVENLEAGDIEADVVNPQAPTRLFDPECHVGVTFYDAKGSVLQTSELKVGPGQTGIAHLAQQNVPPVGNAPSLIRVTFQALDTDGNGRVRPCVAIPSVEIVDVKQLRTVLLVPVLTD